MTDQFRVTLEACVAGNPHKAWKKRLPAGELRDDEFAPDREPPDDVWEQQTHDFTDLDDAKAFILGLPEETTTHVELEYLAPADEPGADSVWETLFVQDAGADHLEDAAPGVVPPHLIDSALPFEGLDEIAEAPPVLPSQAGAQ